MVLSDLQAGELEGEVEGFQLPARRSKFYQRWRKSQESTEIYTVIRWGIIMYMGNVKIECLVRTSP
jgi:hypothetical protein